MKSMDEELVSKRPKAKASEPSTDAPRDIPRIQRAHLTFEEAIVQNEVLERAVAAERSHLKEIASQIAVNRIKRVLIAGCGDSWYVGIGVRLGLEYLLSVPVEPVQALDYALYYGSVPATDCLAIGISSGGNTPAVIQALRTASNAGALTVAVSNQADAPVFDFANFRIFVRASRRGWPTQSSTATMAILLAFGLELAIQLATRPKQELEAFESRLNNLPELMDKTLQMCRKPVEDLAQQLAYVRFLFFCGGGPHLATAYFGAAKVKELCPIHACVIPLEEFHHYRSLKPGDPLILVAPDTISHQRALDTVEVGRYDGGWVFALVPKDEQEIASAANGHLRLEPVEPYFAPFLYCLPLHLFAYYLALEKYNRGLGHTPAFPAEES